MSVFAQADKRSGCEGNDVNAVNGGRSIGCRTSCRSQKGVREMAIVLLDKHKQMRRLSV
jgi:hypothetical protein